MTEIRKYTKPEYGKAPPQAVEVERAVIASILMAPDLLTEAILLLKPEMFYTEAHQTIYKAMVSMNSRNQGVDILTLIEKLKIEGTLEDVGGAYYISKLLDTTNSDSNFEYWCAIIKQKYARRMQIYIGSELQKYGYDDSEDELNSWEFIDKAHKSLSDALFGNVRNVRTIGAIAEENIRRYTSIKAGEVVNGVPVMYKSMQRLVPQYSNGDLIIKAGRPGMGKTAEMISEAKAYAEKGYPVAIFSEEMTAEQLTDRFISQESGIPVTVFRQPGLSVLGVERIANAAKRLKELPIYIEDDIRTIYDVRPKLQQLINTYGVKIAYFDYLQRSRTGNKQPREQEMNEIAQALKTAAKKCLVPIVCYAQLSRSVETRGGDHRPMLSDLRESGAIEQEADMVFFIFRPAYYKVTELDDGRSTERYAEILIEKHRQGSVGKVELEFIGSLMLFKDPEDEYSESKTEDDNENDDLPF
jgi:replicative DNA helicase